jgi:hypothetical protein
MKNVAIEDTEKDILPFQQTRIRGLTLGTSSMRSDPDRHHLMTRGDLAVATVVESVIRESVETGRRTATSRMTTNVAASPAVAPIETEIRIAIAIATGTEIERRIRTARNGTGIVIGSIVIRIRSQQSSCLTRSTRHSIRPRGREPRTALSPKPAKA